MTTTRTHATGCTPLKAEYDRVAATLLSSLGAFRVLAKRGRYPDLIGILGGVPVMVEVKSPAEPQCWRIYDDVKGLTPTGRRFLPDGFVGWREILWNRAAEVSPRGETGMTRTYAITVAGQLLRYVLDYPDLAGDYAVWSGLSLPHVERPAQVGAVLAVPHELRPCAERAMQLLDGLAIATGSALASDARVFAMRINYRCLPAQEPSEG